MRKNQATMTYFSSVSAAFCLELLYFVSCRQGSTSSYCCSAVSRSLIARPPPFLGVSSLNLAALRSGHFFCADFLSAVLGWSLGYPCIWFGKRLQFAAVRKDERAAICGWSLLVISP
jgi:hypothetical protein